MNPDKRNNYPAFPEVCNGQISPGMSLRDWFAGMAMQGLIANCWADSPETPYSQFAFSAYQMADCMLNERDGNG